MGEKINMVLISKFSKQVMKTPDNIAASVNNREITYKEMDEYSNCVAHSILKKRLVQGHIALFFEQGIDMITSVLSVLKAGMTYIPLSDYYPDLRMKYILEDSQTEVIITNSLNLKRAQRVVNTVTKTKEIEILNIDDIAYEQIGIIEADSISANKIAYILYTSGSTGKPKGVMQTQKNILHFARQYAKRMEIGSGTRMTLFSSFCHDAAVVDIFSGILNGATLYPKDIRKETGTLNITKWLIEEKINIWHSVPTLYRHFTSTLGGEEQFRDLRYIVLGGEKVIIQDVERFQKLFSGSTLVNLYGQTESSYNSSQFIGAKDKNVRISIGEKVDETEIFVVDENDEEVMPLNTGEIVINSPYVALGYWNEEEASNVFYSDAELGSLYWTGDIGRLETDGTITWLGRKDMQVKIRGYRVETGDIENCINEIKNIKDAVVVIKEKKYGEYKLIAYYTTIDPIIKKEIKKHITDRLPDYMIPHDIIEINNIPLTASGKVNRKELLELETKIDREEKYEKPRDEIEDKLAKTWEDILGVEKIGINDNFFELGGHSLKATILSGRIQRQMEAEIGVIDIFERPSIRELAEKIREIKGKKYDVLRPLSKRESYPVSSAQKRQYAIQAMDKESIVYNMPLALELKGNIDRTRIEKAIEKLISKHEALRTSFHLEGEEIVQKVNEQVKLELDYAKVEDKKEIDKIIGGWIKPFDLRKAPLLRAGIVERDNCYILMMDMHHIISDGTTMAVLAEDFMEAYEGIELGIEPVQYKEYAEWEKQQKEKGLWDKQKEYWKKEYEGEIPVLELPLDGIRGSIEDNRGDTIDFEIEEKIIKRLKEKMKDIGGTLYMGLMAGYSILMSKYSGQEDIVIGTAVAGRRQPQMERVAGMFVNTLSIRSYPAGEKNIDEYIKETKKKLLGAYENQEYPYEELVEEVGVKRDLSRNPLFDVMLILQNTELKESKLRDIEIRSYEIKGETAKFDLILTAVEDEGRLLCEMNYKNSLFKRETIKGMIRHYIKVLEEISIDTESSIKDIDLLEKEEKRRLLCEFNDTRIDYQREKTIHESFEEQVRKTPNEIALIYEDKKLTYRELNERANSLAKILRDKGVNRDSVVGIMVERSLEMMIGIMAVLKAGGAYLPIDPKFPRDRIQYMLEDSQAQIVLIQENSDKDILANAEGVNIDDISIYNTNISNLENINQSTDLAYVIYTSGSTGKPKGVMVEHMAVNNFIKGMTERIDFAPNKAILALTTICFDIFLLETLLPLTMGMNVVIASEEAQVDPKLLKKVITRNNVNMLQMTPSRLQMLTNSDSDLTFLKEIEEIMIGGEAFPVALFKELQGLTEGKIYNMYGPTETTIWSTIKDLTGRKDINIGNPIANTGIYIVDKEKRLQPIGIPGELCIGGDGLARGYFKRPELTSEKFVEIPFKQGEKMYRTGDLARWLHDGNIEFLGRTDHQVKLRGYRIELEEIENTINMQEGIRESIVIAKGNGGQEQYLCAYLVGDGINVQSIKGNLKKKLPGYMVPTAYIAMDKMPLTPNGKIDRKALGNIKEVEKNRKRIPPRNLHDSIIAEIWSAVLKIDEVYLYDDFFEIGGNSITIIQVASRIKEELKVDVSVADLMVYTTILELSEYIISLDKNTGKGFKHVFKINKSSSKKNIFIVHGADADILYYRHLAKQLEDEYTVYGIQPRGLNGEEPLPRSYFQMLHDYIKEIRMVQNEGPYILAGYCIGGYISYDIVKALEIQGDKVLALLELDQEAFIEDKHRKSTSRYTNILKTIEKWRRLRRKDKMYTLKKFMDVTPKTKPMLKERQMEILSSREAIHDFFTTELPFNSMYCFLGYISTPTLVIKAEENDHRLCKKELWEKMHEGTFEYYEVPGGHETVLFPPYVDRVSQLIKDYLNRVSKEEVKRFNAAAL